MDEMHEQMNANHAVVTYVAVTKKCRVCGINSDHDERLPENKSLRCIGMELLAFRSKEGIAFFPRYLL